MESDIGAYMVFDGENLGRVSTNWVELAQNEGIDYL